MNSELQAALHTVSGLSYLGVFGVSLLANFVIPVPEEIFLLALGYLIAEGFFHPVVVVLVVLLGLMVSDTVLYILARKGNKWVIRLRDRFLSRLSLSKGDFIGRHMNKIIFLARFLIQFRFLGPVLAGSYRVSYKRFFVVNTLALVVYVSLFVFLGDYFHDRVEKVFAGISIVQNIIFVALGIFVAWFFFKLLRRLFVKYMGNMQQRVKTLFGFTVVEDESVSVVSEDES